MDSVIGVNEEEVRKTDWLVLSIWVVSLTLSMKLPIDCMIMISSNSYCQTLVCFFNRFIVNGFCFDLLLWCHLLNWRVLLSIFDVSRQEWSGSCDVSSSFVFHCRVVMDLVSLSHSKSGFLMQRTDGLERQALHQKKQATSSKSKFHSKMHNNIHDQRSSIWRNQWQLVLSHTDRKKQKSRGNTR